MVSEPSIALRHLKEKELYLMKQLISYFFQKYSNGEFPFGTGISKNDNPETTCQVGWMPRASIWMFSDQKLPNRKFETMVLKPLNSKFLNQKALIQNF